MENQLNDDDRRRQIASRRFEEFQTRKRTGGDRVTWVIVLSALVGMFNVFSPSYGRQPGVALWAMILFVAWFLVMTIGGKVNVIGILWGRTIKDLDTTVNERLICLGSLVMPLMSIGLLMWDLVTDVSFGPYGIIGAIAAAVLLYMIYRALRTPHLEAN